MRKIVQKVMNSPGENDLPPSPTSTFKKNWMVIDSRRWTACILDEQGNIEYSKLPNPCGGRHNDK